MGAKRRLGEHPECDPLTDLANHARDAYIRERRIFQQMLTGQESDYRSSKYWDGGKTANGVRSNIWLKVAKFLAENRLDPDIYIHHVFHSVNRRFPVQPNQLCSSDSLALYREYRVIARQLIVEALRSQQEELKRGLRAAQEMASIAGRKFTPKELYLSVLLDEQASLSALFRYCFARKAKLPRVAQLYQKAAAVQYLRNRDEYEEVWDGWIPRDFKEYAKELQCRLLAEKSLDGRASEHE